VNVPPTPTHPLSPNRAERPELERGAEAALATRTRQLEAVRAVTIEITRELDLSTLLGLITRRAKELVGASDGMTRLWDDTRQELTTFAWDGVGEWLVHKGLHLGEGVAGTAALRREGLIVNDFRHSAYASPQHLERTTYTAILAEPLLYREQLVGVLALARNAGSAPFTLDEQEVLRLFAAQAAIAIQNARLYEAVRHELAERLRAEEHLQQELRVNAALATLYGPLISPQTSVEAVARLVLDQARHLTASAHGYVATIDPETGALLSHTLTDMMKGQCRVAEALRGEPIPWSADGQYPALWGHPLNTRRPFFTNAPHEHAAAQGTPAGHISLDRFLSVPVLLGEDLVGQIALANAPTAYSDAQLPAIERLAEIFALAIQRARAEAALRTRTAQLETLRTVSQEIVREMDLGRLLRLITAHASELLHAPDAGLFLWQQDTECLAPEVWLTDQNIPADFSVRLGENLTGLVAQDRKGRIVNNYRTWTAANPTMLRHTRTEAAMAEPLLYHDTLLGVLALADSKAGRRFTEHDAELLRLLATSAAIAIQNARLFRAERERRTQLEALRATTADITRELDLDKLLTLFIQRAVTLRQSVSGVVYLLDPAAGIVTPKAWVGHGDWMRHVRLRPGEGLASAVIQQGRGIIENAYRTSPYAHPLFLECTNHTAVLGEPLVYRDRIIGAILVDRREGVFTEQDRDLLRLLADQAAIAIENARLYTAAQHALADLQRAQDELIRTEKLRGLGQMAAGIAHDLNNTLATILGQTELLRLRARQPEVDEGLQTLQTAASDGAQVVRRLQEFARQRGGGPLSPCDLSRLAPDALEITRPHWQEGPRRKGIVIEVSVNLAGLPLVRGNPAEIREALTNLIFNAVDAMPSGGRLRFTGRVCDESEAPGQAGLPGLSPTQGNAHAAPPSPWVELAISDTGIGMTDEVRCRVFDPFFTTKGLHGTGLGLSVVYGIMERHGGQIDVVSAPGQGTTFRLRFRPASPDAMQTAARPTPAVIPSRRILLVDDDAAVRATLGELLRAHGQEVIQADGGEAGLRCLATSPVDIVLTDLGMPGVNGWDVAREAKARHAGLPVVLLTGWGDQASAEAPPDVSVDRVLAKPVRLATVLATITELTRDR
jgi:signal transduction histidine kinase